MNVFMSYESRRISEWRTDQDIISVLYTVFSLTDTYVIDTWLYIINSKHMYSYTPAAP